ncbi:ABC transporter ATP-binding protein [Geodermatophilus ruber]|uniref:ABC transporter ATP-binding protein n=1 Tax=Geodermatophilus ruber TaxID=504800 RepID=UPI000B87F072|nr:ABC transporter ATP-binding protein [Geodermatophilus ruber]
MWDITRTLVSPGSPEDEALVEAAPTVAVRDIFRRFWPYARPLRWWLLVSMVLGSVGPALEGLGIWLTKLLVDNVLVPRDFSAFAPLAAAYLAITLGTGILGFVGAYLTAWTGESFLHRLRTSVFAHLQTLSIGFFDRRRLGDIISRLTGDVIAIESLILSGVAALVLSALKIVVFAGLLFVLDWQLALISMAVIPVFWLITRIFARRIKAASGEVRRRSGSIATVVEESLGNAPLVQAYGREQAEVGRFTGQSLGSVAAALRATRIGALFTPFVDLVQVVGVITIVGAGAWQLSSGRMTLGDLLAFLLALSLLYGPVSALGQLSTVVFAAAAGAERIIELLDQQAEVRAPEHPVPLGRAAGRIRVEDVDFRYPGTADDVLHGISFSADPGTTTALVGVSGAGKSTLARLLLRLFDPTAGRITLDGHDLRDLDPAELRANIAIVLQETLLLDASVADNIRAGRPDATDEEIVRAARAADAEEFIVRLPEGYDTRVGQRGRLLSGGQRQRVAIARAMVRDAPILLLDEPTASLDAQAAERILGPMRRLMAGRTTIVISHDLLTAAEADQIVHLEHGRIIESGSHEELLQAGNGYAHLYSLRHALRRAPAGGRHRHPEPEPVGPPPWADGEWDEPFPDGPPPWLQQPAPVPWGSGEEDDGRPGPDPHRIAPPGGPR